MNGPKSIQSIFDKRLYRIPDYQRGYSWTTDQLKHLWTDIHSIGGDRHHYAGVLTLSPFPKKVPQESRKYWLIDEEEYECYHVVDGQQRLTTIVILLAALVSNLKKQTGRPDPNLTEVITASYLENKYLFRIHPVTKNPTYIFGYSEFDSSYMTLKHDIFGATDRPHFDATLYTRNLRKAQLFFEEKLDALWQDSGIHGFRRLHRTVVQRIKLNEYMLADAFAVHVAFETMNNRGVSLSLLELVKNRLMYLGTLYTDPATPRVVKEDIISAWKSVYRCLGCNPDRQLNDDEFLRDHWIMYFGKDTRESDACRKFLLERRFTSGNVQGNKPKVTARDIQSYVGSLAASVPCWTQTHFPHLSDRKDVRTRLRRLDRIGMGSFRPLVVSVMLRSLDSHAELAIEILDKIESFLFIAFSMTGRRSNYRSADFHRRAFRLYSGKDSLHELNSYLDGQVKSLTRDSDDLTNRFISRVKDYSGKFYEWRGLKYLLYEYERELARMNEPEKVPWELIDSKSIEHICPQTQTESWTTEIGELGSFTYKDWCSSLGNLLLLAPRINPSLGNKSFSEKKKVYRDSQDGTVRRHGYGSGSHSELAVAEIDRWTTDSIRERGKQILNFMETRWRLEFSEEGKEKLSGPLT